MLCICAIGCGNRGQPPARRLSSLERGIARTASGAHDLSVDGRRGAAVAAIAACSGCLAVAARLSRRGRGAIFGKLPEIGMAEVD